MTASDTAPNGTPVDELMVRAENVHKAFGHLEVLKGIDFDVRPGEVSVVVGPSGSGKSTFLRCINHLEKINAGRIWVAGDLIGYRQRGDRLHEMHDKDIATQRRSVGMVFQRFNLFPHMTALGNVVEGTAVGQARCRGRTRANGRRHCSTVWESATKWTTIPVSSPAASSSASRSPAR